MWVIKILYLARANACEIPMAGDGKVPFVCERILECATPTYGGVGSSQFIRGRCHSRLLEMKLGFALIERVLSQRKSENICVPSVVQLGAATPMLLS